MGLFEGICPQCGAVLTVKENQDVTVCDLCHTMFATETAIHIYNTAECLPYDENACEDVPAVFEIHEGILEVYNGEGGKVVLPEGITEIGDNAFCDCKTLMGVVVPEGVTRIGDFAFDGCIALSNVMLPDTVTEIGVSAFGGCAALQKIDLPESVTRIGESAFCGCGLLSVTVPQSIRKLENEVFWECPDLHSVFIGNGLTEIGDNAFNFCTGLERVELPEGITKIGAGAFADCDTLSAVALPESLINIGEEAFSRCGSLIRMTVPDSVIEIGSRAFAGCTALSALTLPENDALTLGEDVLKGCIALDRIFAPARLLPLLDHNNPWGKSHPVKAPPKSVRECRFCGGELNFFGKCKFCGEKQS